MSERLASILSQVRRRIAEQEASAPADQLRRRCAAAPPVRPLAAALRRSGKRTSQPAPLRVVGELKRQSPSAGAIRGELDVAAIASELAAAGCAALSVLTEQDFFAGSLADLAAARAAVSLPILRKDFILEPYQLLQARAAGADGVLLLAAAHDDAALRSLWQKAQELELAVLAEAHGERELERLLRLDFPIIGLNARDLRDFSTDLERVFRWLQLVPADRIVVAESGVQRREEAQRIAAAGFDAVLIGEGLMRGASPRQRFLELFGERA
jgi:indole-3-glycerol phosphate synthase